jgi:hypothetical protein
MLQPFDIFRVAADGQLVWRTAAESLENAQRRVKILMATEPNDYVIFCQETGKKTLVRASDSR